MASLGNGESQAGAERKEMPYWNYGEEPSVSTIQHGLARKWRKPGWAWHGLQKIPNRKLAFRLVFFVVHRFALSPLLSLGAICQIRTDDLLITSELLYQLS